MITILKYIAMTMFTVGVSYLCFILPPELSSLQDDKTVGHINLETLEETNVELHQQMSMLEKLNLLSSQDSNTNGIILKQGKELSQEKVKEVCEEETKKLVDLGIMEDINIDFTKDYISSRINFYISTADPSKSMIVWNVVFVHDKNSILINLDDETGKIIGYMTNNFVLNYPHGGSIEDIIKLFGDYLDLKVIKSEQDTSMIKDKSGVDYYKTMGMKVVFEENGQQLESKVNIYKTGFSIGLNAYDFYGYDGKY